MAVGGLTLRLATCVSVLTVTLYPDVVLRASLVAACGPVGLAQLTEILVLYSIYIEMK